jgi:hypothetical protein
MRDLLIVGYNEIYNKPFDSNNAIEPFINFLKSHQNKDVLFWHASEPITNPFDFYGWEKLNDFEKLLLKNDLVVYGLFGGDKIFKSLEEPIKNYHVLSWSTFLLHYSKYYLEKSYNKKITDINITPTFDKHFLCLNKHPREQRSITIDYLYKEGLFNYGSISWNKLSKDWQEKYDFEYWEERIMNLDIISPDINKLNIHQSFNTDFLLNNGCVLNYVIETMVDNRNLFISEKTYKNLLIGQPFFSVGSVLHNRTLRSMGFELYDEIFDYSVERCVDLKIKLIQMINQLKTIIEYDVDSLYRLVKDKTIKNKEKSLQICENDPFIPPKLIELYLNHKEKFDENDNIRRECNIQDIFKNKI